jgi:Protein kinase domain
MSEGEGQNGQRYSTQASYPLDDQVAQVADLIVGGDPVDLTTLASLSSEGAAKVRRLIPAMEMMALLRPEPAADEGSGAVNGSSMTVVDPKTPLSDFHTVRMIGRGGMGVVYEAVQLSLNRRVALKILPMLSADDPRKLKRFHIEAQAAALLNDPHIVPVYLVGSENGAHYYAMQLIEGQTLAELISELRDARASAAQPVVGELYLSRREHRRRSGEGEAPTEPALALGSHGGSPSQDVSGAPRTRISPARDRRGGSCIIRR